jgi:hypothetical protein
MQGAGNSLLLSPVNALVVASSDRGHMHVT